MGEKESLQDPTSDACWKLWQNMAERNTEAFFKLLSVWPDSSLRSWGDFHECIKRIGQLPGEGRTWEELHRELLTSVRGRLVFHPIRFLEDEDMSHPVKKLSAALVSETLFV